MSSYVVAGPRSISNPGESYAVINFQKWLADEYPLVETFDSYEGAKFYADQANFAGQDRA